MVPRSSLVALLVPFGRPLVGLGLVVMMLMIVVVVTRHPVPPVETAQGITPFPEGPAVWPPRALSRAEV
jgi:hypothetical protein